MRLRAALVPLLLSILVALSVPSTASAQCTSGTVTVSISTDPGFEGMYKYCLDMEWSFAQYALSHPDLFIGLDDCACVCEPGLITFAAPAGSSTSTEDGESCDSDYLGEYVCMGDPSIPATMNGPAVKWEPIDAGCEPGTSGSGVFCFYSLLPPGDSQVFTDAIAIKHGQEVCYGDISGMLPICDCTVPVSKTSFGTMKSQFDDEEDEDEDED